MGARVGTRGSGSTSTTRPPTNARPTNDAGHYFTHAGGHISIGHSNGESVPLSSGTSRHCPSLDGSASDTPSEDVIDHVVPPISDDTRSKDGSATSFGALGVRYDPTPPSLDGPEGPYIHVPIYHTNGPATLGLDTEPVLNSPTDPSTPILLPTPAASPNKVLTDAECSAAFSRYVETWTDRKAFTCVKFTPTDRRFAKFVGSHTAYRRKADGSAKARIVPWGHRDLDKDYVRGDAPSVIVEVLRLVLSTTAEFGWEIGQIDIKAAYLQATGFSRVIYTRPPREAGEKGVLWNSLTYLARHTASRNRDAYGI